MKSFFRKGKFYRIVINLMFVLLSLSFILPLILVISISFSSEASVVTGSTGYSLIPSVFSVEAYKMALANSNVYLNAYLITAAQAFIGTALSCIIMGMIAYPLSRSNFAFKGPVTFLVFFTMLFNGGMIPTYIIYTQMYHLQDNFLIYILPGLSGGAYFTLIVRTFFKGLPEALFESAKLDGASELKTYFSIAMPLSTPVFATVGFMMLVAKWNDWQTCILYIRSQNLYTLQYLLQRILNEATFLSGMMANAPAGMQLVHMPTYTLRYAICVIAAGPMLIVFPFFQKYFVSGLTIGAVKG